MKRVWMTWEEWKKKKKLTTSAYGPLSGVRVVDVSDRRDDEVGR
jgi:hypothetical protein